jgi:hypothetical protein
LSSGLIFITSYYSGIFVFVCSLGWQIVANPGHST